MMSFWAALDRLVADSVVQLDRPQGSAHPRYPDVIYPLDYGYLQGTTAGDGEGIDVWLGSGNQSQVMGVICTIDLLRKDAEIKVLLGCTSAETRIILDFMRANEIGCTLIERPAKD
jgi:inorganic pyrophosphatase